MADPTPLHLDADQLAIYQGAERICTLGQRAGIRSMEALSWGQRLVECHNDHDQMLALLMNVSSQKVVTKDLRARIDAFLSKVGAA